MSCTSVAHRMYISCTSIAHRVHIACICTIGTWNEEIVNLVKTATRFIQDTLDPTRELEVVYVMYGVLSQIVPTDFPHADDGDDGENRHNHHLDNNHDGDIDHVRDRERDRVSNRTARTTATNPTTNEPHHHICK